jgi:hypothetical protein
MVLQACKTHLLWIMGFASLQIPFIMDYGYRGIDAMVTGGIDVMVIRFRIIYGYRFDLS